MDEVRAAGVDVLGVSFDSVEENRAFTEKCDFPYALLCDTDRAIGLAYSAARTADEA
jgi:peroxiredoxin Q/BCP